MSLRSRRRPYVAVNTVAHFAGCYPLWIINLGFRYAPATLYAIICSSGLESMSSRERVLAASLDFLCKARPNHE